ncbi:NAD(P)/FAD-dependent oxidoreductase [Saccharopolyspora shandongensis]|uniref:flavin-containing monooxygenase n=1 Tax=Saccharopolyspora shandongensis TaxID=418495 RepID=UPI00340821A6
MEQSSASEPTIDDLRRCIHAAETPALLMLVAHLTDDAEVLRPDWRPKPELLPAGGLTPDVESQIRALCLEKLEPLLPTMGTWPQRPSPAVLTAISDWALGSTDEKNVPLLHAAFVPPGVDERAPRWTKDDIAADRSMRVAIIGAGLSGLMAGLRMKQAGIDFTIIEKGDDLGGTWYENTYPDCRIDVHSHIYTYSFYPYDWPSYFCRQGVIFDYLRSFAEEHGLVDHIVLNTEVTAANWDDESQIWTVETIDDHGGERADEYDIVVSAVGQLNRPLIPAIEGLDTFAGPAFHTAQWDHSVDFTGKRVALIGTGASGVQVGPALARQADELVIFQRTAPFLQPTPELRRDLPEEERWLLRNIPLYRSYYRFSIFLPRAIGRLAAATIDPDYPPTERAVSAVNEQLRVLLTDYLLGQVKDRPDLAEKIIPDYPPGAKRIIRDDGTWIETLKRDNVQLIADGVERVDETGVWTADGEHIPVDVIVFATGFKASDFLMPMKVTGRGGKVLHETWGIDACAYFGISVPDFPNMFCLYGPNTGLLLHGNVVFFLECQTVYLLSAIKTLLETGHRAMSLRHDVFEEYQKEVTEESGKRVWGWSKTHSWYQNAEGRSTIMWPLTAHRYVEGTRAAEPEHYELT